VTTPYGDLPAPAWFEPEDAELHWKRDLAHFPGQLTELDGELLRTCIGGGFANVMAANGLPFRYLVRRMWTYHYEHDGVAPMTDEERAALGARMGPVRERMRTSIQTRWQREWLPEIRDHLAFWEGVDPTTLDRSALAAHLDATLERAARLWVVHFELVIAASFAKRALVELYDELFTPDSPLEAQVLLTGFDVLTTQAARALWPLRELVTEGAVRDAFLRVAPRDALTELRSEPAAHALLEALDGYLDAHGHRCPYILYSAPSLFEQPASVMSMLRHMVERPDADPSRLLALQRDKREAAERAVHERLRFYPAPVRIEFASRLADAQTGFVVSEDHNYLIDYTSTARVRQVLLACGAALASEGAIDEAADVFHLRVDELRAAMRGDTERLRAHVAARNDELARYADVEPPFDVNKPAPPSDAETAAEATEAEAPDDPALLRGTAASAGVVRGRARVLRSLADTGALRPGEVLVAPTTGQAWTPLFATAGGLVTESGNLLSHSAVVAREYALPAVVALQGATKRIPDGALVEVDGGAGTVRLLERP
jgi:rifampicin phosphotransferase